MFVTFEYLYEMPRHVVFAPASVDIMKKGEMVPHRVSFIMMRVLGDKEVRGLQELGTKVLMFPLQKPYK